MSCECTSPAEAELGPAPPFHLVPYVIQELSLVTAGMSIVLSDPQSSTGIHWDLALSLEAMLMTLVPDLPRTCCTRIIFRFQSSICKQNIIGFRQTRVPKHCSLYSLTKLFKLMTCRKRVFLRSHDMSKRRSEYF